MEGEKDDVNEVIIGNDESPGDVWFGIGVAVLTGIGGEKGRVGGTTNSFVLVVRCWTGVLCRDLSKYCTSGDGLTCHSWSNGKRPSSVAGCLKG